MILSAINFVSADNGVWHYASDVKSGIFGLDENLDTSDSYTFVNSLNLNSTVNINGNFLSINKNEAALKLIGLNHTYFEFYPQGISGTRKSYI